MSKQIVYTLPIDYMTGNISGHQAIAYDGGNAYEVTTPGKVSADSYAPRLIAKYHASRGRRYYQVRTTTSVNMTAAYRLSLAVMGGAGAVFAKVNDLGPSCQRFAAMPVIMNALRNKAPSFVIDGVTYNNPWQDAGAIEVSPAIYAKFADVLT